MRTSRLLTSVLLGACLLLAPALTARADDTLEGEILDLSCYISHGAKGPAHTKCAESCAQSGMPIGLLAKDGKVYILYAKHDATEGFEQAKALAGQNAKLTGIIQHKDDLLGMEVHAAAKVE